ncbi:uncharacterized protein LOC133195616 [Saccostrea echinata]|uniref:uncharacterized protein LOC133195616 n=1 Tax=Saccostrea echinata TaxID=191078 RepID=UPI002A83D605|nr:uncharacterized protein LOC133195616 [Saccostrea echinata]
MKKSIFSNHVSRRDLFLYGGHKSQKNDKSSFQQISTQSQEFSQGLDGFNLSSGSSEQLSQGRKMFDSYNTPQSSGNKNLASLMKPMSSVSSAPGRPKFQQQYQNNRLKAKENEERELMQTISQTVKECSEEVQNAMKVMPDYLGEHMQMFGDSITKLINDNLQEQFENILLTFQDQKDARHQIGEMKGIIDEKQARIADLQKQLEQHQKAGCQQSMEKVTDVIHKNREHMDKQLLTLIDSNQTITENQQRILEGQEKQLNVGNQNHSELQQRLDNMPKKMGKNNSFAEEIKCIRRELEIQKMEALEFFQGLLTKSSDEQTEDITKQIESEVSRSTKTICNTSSSVANIQKDFLHDTMKEQQEELKAFLKAELQKAHRNQSSQESLDSFTIKHKDYTQSYNDRKCRSAVPIQTEREAVGFVKHQKENDEIRKMDPQQLQFYENPSRGNSNVLTSDVKQKSTQQDFMSPDTNANQSHCKTFFQRPNPSPVATVLPQPQGRGQSRAGKESQEDYEAVNGAQMTQGRAERKNDKFRNIVPKRRSQRIAGFSQNSENSSENGHVSSVPAYASQNFFDSQQLTCSSNESQRDIVPSYAKKPRYNTQDHESHTSLSKNFVPSADCHVPRQPAYNYGTVRPNVRTPSKKFGKGTDVFQFSEENSNFLKTVHGNPISRINKREKLVENDKEVSEESRDSSPSVSITKIMIKRKFRRDSPASSVFSNFRTYSHPKTKPVVTSTPGYQPSESGWKVNRGDVLTKRHESYKRNLMQVDDDLLELSHRIQNQLKRR